MGLRLITPPAPVFSLAEAKAFLRFLDNDEDDLIEGFVESATGYVEQYLGRALMDQTWELVLDGFPNTTTNPSGVAVHGEIKIPKPPLIEVVSVKYFDVDGFEQTVASTEYFVDNTTRPYGWVVPQGGALAWPSTLDAINAVTIRFRAGYLDNSSPPAENIPRDIKLAIQLAVGAYFENRQQTVVGTIANRLPWGIDDHLLRHRVDMSMA